MIGGCKSDADKRSTIGGIKSGAAQPASDWRAENLRWHALIFAVSAIRLMIGS